MAEGDDASIFITQTPVDMNCSISTQSAEDLYLDLFEDMSELKGDYHPEVENITESDEELSQAVESIERFRAPVSNETITEMSRKR